VIVFTDWPGRSPQEVEDQVTYPLTVNLQGLAGVKVVRSQSAFGFSMINVIFEESVDLYFARTRVLERLTLVAGSLPAGVRPTLGPDATGVGQVFWYTIESDRHSLIERRSIQDWYVRYQLNGVPGVAEVGSVGGWVQQYQIDVDPNKLRGYGSAVERSGDGGRAEQQQRRRERNRSERDAWTVVRGLGLIGVAGGHRKHRRSPVAAEPRSTCGMSATVGAGGAFRQGALDRNGTETVGGVVVARYGVDTLTVINGVKAEAGGVEERASGGVRVEPFYDRTELINRATDTLKWALIEEILLVTLAHIIFLFHFRSILIVTLPLPLSILVSFLMMRYFGDLVESDVAGGDRDRDRGAGRRGDRRDGELFPVSSSSGRSIRGIGRLVLETVREATKLVGRPVFFSMAIIVLAFIPVFALTGRGG
jgi:Cu(I)/Ag(I) efflux system membrane protein CusA/SilA